MPIKLSFSMRRALIVISASGVVILLTTLPGRVGLIKMIHEAMDGSQYADLIGHCALFGALTLLLYRVLKHERTAALWIALGTAGGIGVVTEWLQQFSAGRSADRADFVANLLGVFIAATLILSARRQKED